MTLLRISVRRKSAGILQPTAKHAHVSAPSRVTVMLSRSHPIFLAHGELPGRPNNTAMQSDVQRGRQVPSKQDCVR